MRHSFRRGPKRCSMDSAADLLPPRKPTNVCSNTSWKDFCCTGRPVEPAPAIPGWAAVMAPSATAWRGSPEPPRWAAWSAGGWPPNVRLESGTDVDLPGLIRTGLLSGTDPGSPEYWARLATRAIFAGSGERLLPDAGAPDHGADEYLETRSHSWARAGGRDRPQRAAAGSCARFREAKDQRRPGSAGWYSRPCLSSAGLRCPRRNTPIQLECRATRRPAQRASACPVDRRARRHTGNRRGLQLSCQSPGYEGEGRHLGTAVRAHSARIGERAVDFRVSSGNGSVGTDLPSVSAGVRRPSPPTPGR